MKIGIVVGAVGLAFGAGILTALSLMGQPQPPAQAGRPQQAPAAQQGAARDVKSATVDGAKPAAGATGGPQKPPSRPVEPSPGSAPPVPPPIDAPQPPSTPPPPPSPQLLREGEKALAEQGQGNGQTTDLHYPFKDEAERAEWEASRKASWTARLARERDIKIRIMREKCGLTAAQEPRLVEILDEEAKERERLVDALAAKQISRTSFDEQAKAAIQKGRDALAKLLTPDQVTAFNQLKPREQVLRDETH